MRRSPTYRGYSLIELLMYVVLLSVLLVAMLEMAQIMLNSYAGSENSAKLASSGESVLERMERNIRLAQSVDGSSALGINPGTLVLVLPAGNATSTISYAVQNGVLAETQNGQSTPLLVNGVTVSSLTFTATSTPHDSAVHVDMTLSAGDSSAAFHDTTILRGSYH